MSIKTLEELDAWQKSKELSIGCSRIIAGLIKSI